MTRLHAVRVAARVRRELNTEAEVVGGRYGQFSVLLDGAAVLDGGRLAVLGIVPSSRKIIEALRTKLNERRPAAS